MEIKNDKVVFSTGRKFNANCGIIGLASCDNEEEWAVSGGYDDGFGGYLSEDLTTIERIELADYMIDLWKQFKARYDETR